MKIEDRYDDYPHHRKEAAGLPFHFNQLKIDQQLFFRDFFDGLCDNKQEKETLIEDLTLLKFDLEMIIANTKK